MNRYLFICLIIFAVFEAGGCAPGDRGEKLSEYKTEMDTTKKKNNTTSKYNPLTPEEERVIVHKGTERPFTGKYYEHKEDGTYICKRCNAPLYRSSDKLDAHCGWPGFDDEIAGSVKKYPDADGMRTEIVCANCDGHLGHVFSGEGYTEKNIRHCVNSVSIKFIPAGEKNNPSVIKK